MKIPEIWCRSYSHHPRMISTLPVEYSLILHSLLLRSSYPLCFYTYLYEKFFISLFSSQIQTHNHYQTIKWCCGIRSQHLGLSAKLKNTHLDFWVWVVSTFNFGWSFDTCVCVCESYVKYSRKSTTITFPLSISWISTSRRDVSAMQATYIQPLSHAPISHMDFLRSIPHFREDWNFSHALISRLIQFYYFSGVAEESTILQLYSYILDFRNWLSGTEWIT